MANLLHMSCRRLFQSQSHKLLMHLQAKPVVAPGYKFQGQWIVANLLHRQSQSHELLMHLQRNLMHRQRHQWQVKPVVNPGYKFQRQWMASGSAATSNDQTKRQSKVTKISIVVSLQWVEGSWKI